MASSFDFNLPAGLTLASGAVNAASKLAGGRAAKVVGQRRQAEFDNEAAQLEQNANNAAAVGQRNAQAQDLQTQLVASRALAVAAASGAGASDPTVINTIARINQEGSYRSMMDLYAGEERERAMNYQATLDRYSGGVAASDAGYAEKMSRFGAAATILQSAGTASLYSRYGAGGPQAMTSPDS